MKVPMVVLTGFLGAGKTSLVNRVIAARAAAGGAAGKVAIIVNELGAIGIDADLLPRGAARQVELPGGCVCCVLSDDLDRTVLEILDGNPEIDTMILETTGVAEPIPIVWTLERAPVVERVRVAAIVTVVDPTSWPQARATSEVAEIQVEGADVVLLSKLDLAAPADVERARAEVAALAPHAPIVSVAPDAAAAWLVALLADPPERSDRGDDHAGHHHAPGAGHGIDSVALPIAAALDLELFEEALAALPTTYFRVKALVDAVDPRLGGVRDWFAVHRVGGRVSSEPIAAPGGGARVVGLGVGVTAEPLAACVAGAVLPSARGPA